MALEMSQKVDAGKWAKNFFQRAQGACRQGQIYFKQRLYKQALRSFEVCLQWAEKAEELARLRRHREGDIL